MEITLQKSLQTVQELTKKNKDYEHEVKKLKEDRLLKTSFKKWLPIPFSTINK